MTKPRADELSADRLPLGACCQDEGCSDACECIDHNCHLTDPISERP